MHATKSNTNTNAIASTKTQKQTITIDFLSVAPASHLIVPFKFPVNWHCSQTVLRSNRLDKCEEGDHLFGCIFFLFVSSSSSLPYFFAVCFFFFPIIGKLLSLTNWNSIFEWASECTSVNERNIKIKTVFWHWHRRKQRRQWQIFIYTFSTLYRFRFPLATHILRNTRKDPTHYPSDAANTLSQQLADLYEWISICFVCVYLTQATKTKKNIVRNKRKV